MTDLFAAVADLLDPPPPPTAAEVWADLDWQAQPKQAQAQAQALADDTNVFELLYGGAVGGGKSEFLLLHIVSEMIRHPGNRGLILRRDTMRLKRSLLPRAETLLAGIATLNRNDGTFTFPNGSVLEFGHLEHAKSVHIYSGAEYGVVGFEEVTEFLEAQWDYLSTRLRAPVPGVRVHMVATTNPGGVGHRWVKRRWVKPKPEDVATGSPAPEHGSVWQARPTTEGEAPIVRAFVPSTLDDNPALLARDPGYKSRVLAGIKNRATRLALASGDWDAIDAIEGALWTWSMIEDHRVSADWIRGGAEDPFGDHYSGSGGLARCVVAVDPAATSTAESDETGIIVAGKGRDGRFYVADDRSVQGASPDEWGRRAVKAYHDHEADSIVVERNNGGDMVAHVIATVDPSVPVRTVWASRGKVTRAEPVAALYEQGRVSHVGAFTDLEEQITTWTPDSGDSPDRMDALVWALWALGVDQAKPTTTTEYGEGGALEGSR